MLFVLHGVFYAYHASRNALALCSATDTTGTNSSFLHIARFLIVLNMHMHKVFSSFEVVCNSNTKKARIDCVDYT